MRPAAPLKAVPDRPDGMTAAADPSGETAPEAGPRDKKAAAGPVGADRPSAIFGSPLFIDVLVVVLYLLAAGYVSMGLILHPDAHSLALNEPDRVLEEWFLAHGGLWWSGDFDLVSTRMNVPDGINLMANASLIMPSVLLALITLVLGAPVTFVALLIGNLAGVAVGWYLLLSRTLRLHRLAGFFAGLLCGFAPGMIAQSMGHLSVTSAVLVAPMVWCVVRLYRGIRPVATGVLLAALVVAQLLTGEEVLFLATLGLALFTVLYAGLDRRRAKQAARPLLTGLAVTASTAGALVAYPLWVQFAGRQAVSGGPYGTFASFYSTDVASLVAVSPYAVLGNPATAMNPPGPAEHNGNLGWPLLLAAALAVVWLRRMALAWATAGTALLALVLSLGPEITISGERTGLAGPYALLVRIPVVDAGLPGRIALAAVPPLALLFALAVHRALTERTGIRYFVLAAVPVVLLPLVPAPLPTGHRAPVPAFITEEYWRDCVDPGGVLVPVPLPTPTRPDTLRWATAAHAWFAVPEGYFIGPYGGEGSASIGIYPRPTSALLNKVAETGEVPLLGAEQQAQAAADVAYWKADCLALATGAAAVPHAGELQQTLEFLYGPGRQVADAWVWDVGSLR